MSKPSKNPVVYGELPQFSSGDVITALEFNKIIDRLRSQGDINAQWCAFLQNEGIPAAIADVSAEDVASYISASITAQLNSIVASSAAKTTDYWNAPTIAIIATAAAEDTEYSSSVWATLAAAGVTKHVAGQEVSAVGKYCYNWYSGGSITSLDSDAREQEFAALAECASDYSSTQPIVAYTESTTKLSSTYWKDGVYAYCYNSTESTFPTCTNAKSDVLAGYIPVMSVSTGAAFTAALNTVTNASFAVIAVPIDVLVALNPSLTNYTVLPIGEYISAYKQCTGNQFGRVDFTSEGPKLAYTNVYTGVPTMHLLGGSTWYSFTVTSLATALSKYLSADDYTATNSSADADDDLYIRKPIKAASSLIGLTASVTELNYMDGVTENMVDLLAGKAASSHTHAIADVTNLSTSLAGKAAASHTHTASDMADTTVCTNANVYKYSGFTLDAAVTGNTALYTSDFIPYMNTSGTAWLIDYYCSDVSANITGVSVSNNQISVTYDKQIQGSTCFLKATWADALNINSSSDAAAYSQETTLAASGGAMITAVNTANTALIAARTASDDE